MRNASMRPILAALSVPLLALCLTSCAGSERLAVVKPAAVRLEPVAEPEIPDATTPCGYDPAAMCLTDAETAGVLAAYARALRSANDRILWLRDWFAALPDQRR